MTSSDDLMQRRGTRPKAHSLEEEGGGREKEKRVVTFMTVYVDWRHQG